MSQYPIPQFIEKEGRIIFFLTFRQFFYLVGGGLVCLFFYFVLPSFLFIPLALTIILTVVAIAFIKIDNASILTIFLNFINFSAGNKNYTWKKKEAAYPFKVQKKPEIKKLEDDLPPMHVQQSKLHSIKSLVETKR